MLQRHGPAGESNRAGADGFEDFVFGQHLENRVDFVLRAGQFDDDIFAADIDNLCAEDVDDMHDFGAYFAIRLDLDHDKLALNRIEVAEIDDLDDVDEARDIGHDLIELLLGIDGNGDAEAADFRIFRDANAHAVDVEAAATEEAHDMRQNTRFIIGKNAQ